ncbi:MAG: hypothetical protein IJ043_01515 [Clostridia bacterium]|nr:hypothetical protein [Clostridia bacterium]
MNYDDIIHLPHPTSSKRMRMPAENRAAQFAPFAALTGHEAAIAETARLTDLQAELDDGIKAMLNEKLVAAAARKTTVTVTYFVPDPQKNGGAYLSTTGTVKRIDEYSRTLLMADGTAIPIDCLYEIEDQE